jgi:hypothetical protein
MWHILAAQVPSGLSALGVIPPAGLTSYRTTETWFLVCYSTVCTVVTKSKIWKALEPDCAGWLELQYDEDSLTVWEIIRKSSGLDHR